MIDFYLFTKWLELEFSKSIMNVLELFLTLFQVERPLCSYIISLMDHFVCPAIMESISFSKKLMMIDLSNKENLLLDESIDLGFGTTKSTQKGGSKCYGKVDQKA